jgi:23S rRNA (uracil1939-C5)-methyltransferase
MSSRSFPLTIDRLSYGAAGVGRLNGKVVFVPETAPGDEVEVTIAEEKKGYARGSVEKVLRPSLQRQVPPCPYVQQCGGCPWQQVRYEAQLRAKEELVREQLRRIGGMSDIPLLPIIPSPQEWHYRQRIRLRVEGNTRIGFSPSRSHALVEVESCVIAWPEIAKHLSAVREWIATLRTAVTQIELALHTPAITTTEERIVCVGDVQGMFQQEDDLRCQRFIATSPHIAGVILRGREWRRAWGDTTLTWVAGEDRLHTEADAFTQVNSAANQFLVERLVRLSGVSDSHRVIELYCGAGNLSFPLARRARELIGVEQNRRAVHAARANAARVGVKNAQFKHATARKGVRELLKQGVQGDLVVLDPPRTGAAEVMEALPRFGARTIAYVSCDPTTLARDLHRLQRHGYRLHTVQPLDMFPQTYHVETIAVSVLTC